LGCAAALSAAHPDTVNALRTVSELARELCIEKHPHLWPDKSCANRWPTGCRIPANT